MTPDVPQGQGSSRVEARQAVVDILRKQADLAVAEARPSPPRRDHRPVVLITLAAVSAVLWLSDLPFMHTADGAPLDPAARVANERFSLFLQTQRVEQFRVVHGRLPATLQEAGDPFQGVHYQPYPDGSYRVSLDTSDGVITFRSGERADKLMGGGMKVLGLVKGGS